MQIADRTGVGVRGFDRELTLPRAGAHTRLLPCLVVCAAVVLRVVPLLANYPLHRDEALYGAWARLIASGADPLLLTAWVDKPPLVIYLLAGSLRAFGVSNLALRLPGMFASVVCVFLTFALARRAHGRSAGLLAAVLCAFSPFAILFAPTAFTDPWLTIWMLASAWAALGGRSFWAGLCLGLAVASKQQGALAVPLVIGLLVLQAREGTPSASKSLSLWAFLARRFLPALAGFLVIFIPVTYWDSLRWLTRPSYWGRSLDTYGGLRMAMPAEWPPRLSAWIRQATYLYAAPAVTAVILALSLLPAILALGWRSFHAEVGASPHEDVILSGPVPNVSQSGHPSEESREARNGDSSLKARGPLRWLVNPLRVTTGAMFETRTPPSGATPDAHRKIDLLLSVYILGYMALHVLVTFQPWDRYLLPILPLIAILAARGCLAIWQGLAHQRQKGVAQPAMVAGMAGMLIWASWMGASGRLPVGSDHGAFDNLDKVVAFVRSRPPDALIYQYSLGWYFDFYLFDAPQQRPWWEDNWKLADLASRAAGARAGREQWLVLTGWEDPVAERLPETLASWGLALREEQTIYRHDRTRAFSIYRIIATGERRTP